MAYQLLLLTIDSRLCGNDRVILNLFNNASNQEETYLHE